MKYTWTCFFWEFRAVSSTVLVLIFFYHIRLIDTLLKHFLEHLLTKKIELRVEIEDLILDLLNKKCHIHGIMIYHPTIAEDPRWHYEYLCYAKSVTFTFDPLQSFYAFCKSDFSLVYMDEIVVQTIDLYVEGFEDTVFDEEGNASKNKILNLELLGGPPYGKRKKKQSTQTSLQETPRTVSEPSQSLEEEQEMDERGETQQWSPASLQQQQQQQSTALTKEPSSVFPAGVCVCVCMCVHLFPSLLSCAHAVLSCTVLYCPVLSCTVLHCPVLSCTVLHCSLVL